MVRNANRRLKEPMSKKAVTLLFVCLILFSIAAYLTLTRIPDNTHSSNLIFIGFAFTFELVVICICLYTLYSEWLPRNFKTRYVWYWYAMEDESRVVYCDTRKSPPVISLCDPHDIPAATEIGFPTSRFPVAFRIKFSGWFGRHRVFIEGAPSDDWTVKTMIDHTYLNRHVLTIYDKKRRPLHVCGHTFDNIKLLLWVVESFPDLEEYWQYIYNIADERLDMINTLLVLEEASSIDGTMGNKWQAKLVHDCVGAELDRVIGRELDDDHQELILPTEVMHIVKRQSLATILHRCTNDHRRELISKPPVVRCGPKKPLVTT